MTKPSDDLIRKLARESQGLLVWVEANAETIAANYERWSNDAIKARSYEGDGRGGQELTHPEREADARIAGLDTVEADWSRFMGLLTDLRKDALDLKRAGGNFMLDSSIGAKREASSIAELKKQPAGAGYCDNCGRMCSGSRGVDRRTGESTEDRIKGRNGRKLCSPGCYEYEVRTGTPRPKERWAGPERPVEKRTVAVTPGTPSAPPCPVYTHLGTTYTCERTPGHDGPCMADGEMTWQRAAVG